MSQSTDLLRERERVKQSGIRTSELSLGFSQFLLEKRRKSRVYKIFLTKYFWLVPFKLLALRVINIDTLKSIISFWLNYTNTKVAMDEYFRYVSLVYNVNMSANGFNYHLKY